MPKDGDAFAPNLARLPLIFGAPAAACPVGFRVYVHGARFDPRSTLYDLELPNGLAWTRCTRGLGSADAWLLLWLLRGPGRTCVTTDAASARALLVPGLFRCRHEARLGFNHETVGPAWAAPLDPEGDAVLAALPEFASRPRAHVLLFPVEKWPVADPERLNATVLATEPRPLVCVEAGGDWTCQRARTRARPIPSPVDSWRAARFRARRPKDTLAGFWGTGVDPADASNKYGLGGLENRREPLRRSFASGTLSPRIRIGGSGAMRLLFF